MGYLGGHRAFAGAARTHQEDAARFFEIDRGGLQALGDGKRQRRVGARLRKIRGLPHQGLAQTFGQAVALDRRAQQAAQVGAGKGEEIGDCAHGARS
jgi:hypothetical protein